MNGKVVGDDERYILWSIQKKCHSWLKKEKDTQTPMIIVV